MHRRARKLAATATGILAVACLAAPSGASAGTACSKFASPAGSDSGTGTESAPFRSSQRLVNSLEAGQVGCLKAGTYEGLDVRKGGAPGAPITLRSYPGDRVEVNGRFWVARTAPHVVVEGLYLNGKNSTDHPSPTVNAPDVAFRGNDVTNDHTAICFILGGEEWGRADGAVVENNRIHDCGKLPAEGFDHGIYVEAASGSRVEGNWLYDNADYGVHLYPDADHTLVRGNVIDGNGKGVLVASEGGESSDDNRVEGNVITNSSKRFNVQAWWPKGSPVPSTSISRNCLKAGPVDWFHNGGVDMEVKEAYTAMDGNLVTSPDFADRSAKDFRLVASSPCREVFGGDPAAVPGPDGLGPMPAPRPPTTSPPASKPASVPRQPSPRATSRRPRPKSRARGKAPVTHRRAARKRTRVTLRVVPLATSSRAGRTPLMRLIGRVRGAHPRRVLIQVARRGGWRTVAVVRARRGRFSRRLRISHRRAARLRLRALAPGVGRSRAVSVSRH
jgi:parallel beta-helix repeat protein